MKMYLDLLMRVMKYASKFFKTWRIVKFNYWMIGDVPHALVHIRIHDEELRLRFRMYEGSLRVVDSRLLTRSQIEKELLSNGKESEQSEQQ